MELCSRDGFLRACFCVHWHALLVPLVGTSISIIGGGLTVSSTRLLGMPMGSELAYSYGRHRQRKMKCMQLEDTIQVEASGCGMEAWHFEGVSSPLPWGDLVSYPRQVK